MVNTAFTRNLVRMTIISVTFDLNSLKERESKLNQRKRNMSLGEVKLLIVYDLRLDSIRYTDVWQSIYLLTVTVAF